MPSLDVDDAFDPSMLDNITVVRRAIVVDQYGRGQITDTPHAALAVIGAASPDDLRRLPEAEMQEKTIGVWTPFRLQGAAMDAMGNQMHPDQIQWHGDTYIVRVLDDWSGYGRGFVYAVATVITALPAPMGLA
jgi:hypothetical protein